MENNTNNGNNYTYPSSYPDSGDSSPRSRADVDQSETINPSSPPPPCATSARVKLMISYGGRIQPRQHDNQLAYLNGETKILSIDRSMKFTDFHAKLTSLSGAGDVRIKYQLPGEDLDALISVTNDEDLDHLILEFDRLNVTLNRSSSCRSTPRIRVFLFPISRSERSERGETKAERHWFVDALNSVPPLAPQVQSNAPDYLFGLESGFVPPPAVKVTVLDPVPAMEEKQNPSDSSPVEVQKQIQELERVQIGDNHPPPPTLQAAPTMARSGSDETLTRQTYLSKPQEIKPPVPAPVQSVQQVQSPPASAVPQPTVTAPAGYYGSMAGGGGGDHRPVYLIPPGYFTTGGASFVYAMPPPGQTAVAQGGAGGAPAMYYTSVMPSGYRHQAVTSSTEGSST